MTSNIPLTEQYKKYQTDEPETWRAFCRRIHKVIDFDKVTKPQQLEFVELTEEQRAGLPF